MERPVSRHCCRSSSLRWATPRSGGLCGAALRSFPCSGGGSVGGPPRGCVSRSNSWHAAARVLCRCTCVLAVHGSCVVCSCCCCGCLRRRRRGSLRCRGCSGRHAPPQGPGSCPQHRCGCELRRQAAAARGSRRRRRCCHSGGQPHARAAGGRSRLFPREARPHLRFLVEQIHVARQRDHILWTRTASVNVY